MSYFIFFLLSFGCLKANSGSLTVGQSHPHIVIPPTIFITNLISMSAGPHHKDEYGLQNLAIVMTGFGDSAGLTLLDIQNS